MSLKIFHGLFIVISILFTAGFAFYGFTVGEETLGDSAPIWGGVSGVLALILVVYGVLFIQKFRRIH